jgi:hypothetical protein
VFTASIGPVIANKPAILGSCEQNIDNQPWVKPTIRNQATKLESLLVQQIGSAAPNWSNATFPVVPNSWPFIRKLVEPVTQCFLCVPTLATIRADKLGQL